MAGVSLLLNTVLISFHPVRGLTFSRYLSAGWKTAEQISSDQNLIIMNKTKIMQRFPEYCAPESESVLMESEDLLCVSVTNEDIDQIDPFDGWDN